jgi:hypothetical protein
MEDVEADVFASRDGGALNDDVVWKVVKLGTMGLFPRFCKRLSKAWSKNIGNLSILCSHFDCHMRLIADVILSNLLNMFVKGSRSDCQWHSQYNL